MALLVRENVPLAPLSTIGVGGPARYYVRAADVDELLQAADWAHTRRQPLLLLGGGSNLIVSDTGFPGLVIHMALRGVETDEDRRGCLLRAGAGEPWDGVVSMAVSLGWAGIECLAGIPGYVGATP